MVAHFCIVRLPIWNKSFIRYEIYHIWHQLGIINISN